MGVLISWLFSEKMFDARHGRAFIAEHQRVNLPVLFVPVPVQRSVRSWLFAQPMIFFSGACLPPGDTRALAARMP
jgi:hypothetical protein